MPPVSRANLPPPELYSAVAENQWVVVAPEQSCRGTAPQVHVLYRTSPWPTGIETWAR